MQAANLKKAALLYIASKMPEKNIDELRKLFIQIDTNGDGKITCDEFWKALQSYGFDYTLEEAKILLDKLDTNKNGYIDYTEFIAGCLKSKIYLKEELLKRTFQYFDKDNSGTITLEELKEVLSSKELEIPDSDIQKLITEVDLNGDNVIDYNEFLEMMKKDLRVRLAVYNLNLKDLLVYKPQCSIF